MKKLIALATGFVVASSLPSLGQSLTWDLGTNGSGILNNTSIGNKLTSTLGGVTMIATGWSYTKGTSNSALEIARLGHYSPGIGVINNEEDGTGGWHQVDNRGQNDYVLFVFNQLVDITNVKIKASPGPYDQDVSYWVGNVSTSNLSTLLDNVNYAGLAGLGFGNEKVVSGNSSTEAKNVSIQGYGVNAILFGPERGLESHDQYTDAFKIQTISATPVPEPSAALLSLMGVCGLLLRRRR